MTIANNLDTIITGHAQCNQQFDPMGAGSLQAKALPSCKAKASAAKNDVVLSVRSPHNRRQSKIKCLIGKILFCRDRPSKRVL